MSNKFSELARFLGVLKLSRRQLQQRWLESTLIILGIALGVGVLTAGETFVRFQNTMNETFTAGQIREWEAVTITPGRQFSGSEFFGPEAVAAVRLGSEAGEPPPRFTLEDLLALRAVPGVKYVTTSGGMTGVGIVAVDDVELEPDVATEGGAAMAGAEMRSGAVSITVQPTDDGADTENPLYPALRVEMVTPDEFGALGYGFLAGSPFTWDDYFAGAERLVVESTSARTLFPDLSPEEMIGRTLTTETLGPGQSGSRWTIVGVLEYPEQMQMMMGLLMGFDEQAAVFGYVPASATWGERMGAVIGPDGTFAPDSVLNAPRLYATPVGDEFIPDVVAEAQVYFDQKYGAGRVELRNPSAERASGTEGLASTVIALLVLAGLGLIIAAVNVLNLFTARVMRRVRIAAMSIALGAGRRLLFWQTAGEALLLGAVGSVLGLAIASGFVGLIRSLLTAQAAGELPPGFDLFAGLRLGPVDAGIGLLAGIGLSLTFGLYPAWLGSRQNPAEALRVE